MPKMLYLDHRDLVNQIATRSSERDFLNKFLDSHDGDGVPIADKLYEAARNEVKKASGIDSDGINKGEIVEATIKRYKQNKSQVGLSAYDEMVLDLIAIENNARDLVNNIKRGKITTNSVPHNFPGMRKRAEILFHGKVSSDVKTEDYIRYRTEKQYASILRDYARDLFFAINQGAEGKASDFLHLIYSLNRVKTAEPVTAGSLRKLILNSLVNGDPLEIVHIKSLRFTYPSGTNLKILENTAPVEQSGLPGELRKYPDEEVIFERIARFRKIFEDSGIRTRVTVIVSDHDLDYCFPTIQNIVPVEDVERGKKAVRNYIDNLNRLHPEVECIKPISQYLAGAGLSDTFARTFSMLIQECERGGGRFINEKVIEMRVNEQFEHYSQMFGSYSRELARYTTVHNLSSILSLSVLFESFASTPLLVIDTRGLEDRLIGAFNPNSVVKFFTKLKDPTEIIKN